MFALHLDLLHLRRLLLPAEGADLVPEAVLPHLGPGPGAAAHARARAVALVRGRGARRAARGAGSWQGHHDYWTDGLV